MLREGERETRGGERESEREGGRGWEEGGREREGVWKKEREKEKEREVEEKIRLQSLTSFSSAKVNSNYFIQQNTDTLTPDALTKDG